MRSRVSASRACSHWFSRESKASLSCARSRFAAVPVESKVKNARTAIRLLMKRILFTVHLGFASAKVRDIDGLRLLRNIFHANDSCTCTEFLVVAIGNIDILIEVLQQGKAHVNVHGGVVRQPDFIFHPRLLVDDARALVQSSQEQTE